MAKVELRDGFGLKRGDRSVQELWICRVPAGAYVLPMRPGIRAPIELGFPTSQAAPTQINPQKYCAGKTKIECGAAKRLIFAVFLQYYSSKALLCGRPAHRINVTGRDSACLWLNEILPGADSASDSAPEQAQDEHSASVQSGLCA
jgi:hypothetical protein